MTKLEWCRENAPEVLKDMPDDALLDFMSSAYEKFCEDVQSGEVSDVADIDTHAGRLDYMFMTLVQEFGDNLTFKGGYMLTKILNRGLSRRTEDIDFSILTDEIYDNIKDKLSAIGEFFISKGVVARYEIKPEVQPTMSGGVKFYNEEGQVILGVDVGWHDTTYCVTNYKINNIDCKGFRPERMVGDKLMSILSRKRFRRSKDLYDLYIISLECDLDLTAVHACIVKRMGNDSLWDTWPFDENIMREYRKAYDKLDVRSIDGSLIKKASYEEAFEILSVIAPAVKRSVPGRDLMWNFRKGVVESK